MEKPKRQTIILIILIPTAAVIGGIFAWSNISNIITSEINIAGSSTVYKIISNTSRVFTETHLNTEVTVQSTDSTAGINALVENFIDIAMCSRPVTEMENLSANNNLKSFVIANDVLAIVVNSAANQFNLTIDQVKAIFNGTITSWDDPIISASGLTGEIQVVIRESGSGSRDFFNEYVMGDVTQSTSDSKYPDNAIEKTSNELMLEAVSLNENYIGYLGLGFITENVLAIGVNGIIPNFDTIKNDTYPIQRDLYLVTNGYPIEGSIIKEFINWAYSFTSQNLIRDIGFVPVIEIPDKWELVLKY